MKSAVSTRLPTLQHLERLGDVIARTPPYARLPTYPPTKTRIFFGSWVMCFWRDLSCHIETPTYFLYKEVYLQKLYQNGPLDTLEESHKEYLQMSHPGYSALTWHQEHKPQEPWITRGPRERDAEQSAPINVRPTHCTSRQLGTTAAQRYDIPWDWLWDACLMARECWETPKTCQCGHTSPWRWRP